MMFNMSKIQEPIEMKHVSAAKENEVVKVSSWAKAKAWIAANPGTTATIVVTVAGISYLMYQGSQDRALSRLQSAERHAQDMLSRTPEVRLKEIELETLRRTHKQELALKEQAFSQSMELGTLQHKLATLEKMSSSDLRDVLTSQH